jgi:hypothetical protein
MDERNNEAETATSEKCIDSSISSTLDDATYDEYLKNIGLDDVDLKNIYNTI